MAHFIVCPDGSVYEAGRVTAEQVEGRAVVAATAEAALHIAYEDGDAVFPPLPHYDGLTDPAAWARVRDDRILAATRRLIAERGLSTLTREAIARAAGMKPGTISNFGRANFKQTGKPAEGYRTRILAVLMADALAKGDIAMMRVGIADGCLRAEDVPDGLRAAVGV